MVLKCNQTKFWIFDLNNFRALLVWKKTEKCQKFPLQSSTVFNWRTKWDIKNLVDHIFLHPLGSKYDIFHPSWTETAGEDPFWRRTCFFAFIFKKVQQTFFFLKKCNYNFVNGQVISTENLVKKNFENCRSSGFCWECCLNQNDALSNNCSKY